MLLISGIYWTTGPVSLRLYDGGRTNQSIHGKNEMKSCVWVSMVSGDENTLNMLLFPRLPGRRQMMTRLQTIRRTWLVGLLAVLSVFFPLIMSAGIMCWKVLRSRKCVLEGRGCLALWIVPSCGQKHWPPDCLRKSTQAKWNIRIVINLRGAPWMLIKKQIFSSGAKSCVTTVEHSENKSHKSHSLY